MKCIFKIALLLFVILQSFFAISQIQKEEDAIQQKIRVIIDKQKVLNPVFERVLPGVNIYKIAGKFNESDGRIHHNILIVNDDTICYKWQINILTERLGSRSNFSINDLIKVYLYLSNYQLMSEYRGNTLCIDSIIISNESIYTSPDSVEYNKFNYKATFNFCGAIKQCLFYIENKQIYRKVELHPSGKILNREKVKIVTNLKSKSPAHHSLQLQCIRHLQFPMPLFSFVCLIIGRLYSKNS